MAAPKIGFSRIVVALCVVGTVPAYDYLMAWRAEPYVARLEDQAARGQCTEKHPCRVDGLAADMCNTLTGGLLVSLWWTGRIATRLPGTLKPASGVCARASDDNTVLYVAENKGSTEVP